MTRENQTLRIAKANLDHLPRVVELMRELAEFEKLLNEFRVTEELLERYLFGDNAAAELLIGYVGNEICQRDLWLRALLPQLLHISRSARNVLGGRLRSG